MMRFFELLRVEMAALVAVLVLTMSVTSPVSADEGFDDDAVATAQATTDSLISALLAAVLDVTFRTTPETVVPESQAIALLLPRSQRAYRLIDVTGDPLNPRNRPRGRFEREAVERAREGETTQVVRGGTLRTVVPLPFAAANCALCHENYVEFDSGAIIGAISLQVRIGGDDDKDRDD